MTWGQHSDPAPCPRLVLISRSPQLDSVASKCCWWSPLGQARSCPGLAEAVGKGHSATASRPSGLRATDTPGARSPLLMRCLHPTRPEVSRSASEPRAAGGGATMASAHSPGPASFRAMPASSLSDRLPSGPWAPWGVPPEQQVLQAKEQGGRVTR